MSEFQNRAVRLMVASVGDASTSDISVRRTNVLTTALELYVALGGSHEQLETAIAKKESDAPSRIDLVIGDLMMEMATISHIHDIDVMQAAHNALDSGVRETTSA
ncbi:hypothetical protein [Ensifer adhaerens]|uniref:hypothetical protein n=1 Tax=Ensifer adhaerens TaxID=106592 RepID=UPI00080753CC|nr:hypothetical protein [Ensifer adhaerens]